MLEAARCLVVGHEWARHRYEATQGDDQPELLQVPGAVSLCPAIGSHGCVVVAAD